MKVTIKIKHIPTGEIRDYSDEFDYSTELSGKYGKNNWYNPVFIWEHGNYACDCNRHLFFTDFKDESDFTCSHNLYKVNIFDPNNKCLYKEY